MLARSSIALHTSQCGNQKRHMRRSVRSVQTTTETLTGIPTKTVWAEFTPLAISTGAINLGQGFPDFQPEEFIVKNTRDALDEGSFLQYARSQGHPALVNIIADIYSEKIGKPLDPLTNILVTAGGTEAIYLVANSLLNPGDECLLIEPFYDSYPISVKMAGAVPLYVPLRPRDENTLHSKDWYLDYEEIERTITPKTKMMMINSPQNCPGKIFTEEELRRVADIANRHDIVVVFDAVYEELVFDGVDQITYLSKMHNMFDKTLTICSSGKLFNVTGFKVGWTIGSAELIQSMAKIHQQTMYCVPTVLQESVARNFQLAKTNGYWQRYRELYTRKRGILVDALSSAGLTPIMPEGSFFALAKHGNISPDRYMDPNSDETRDYQFCRWLTKDIGVCAIPPSAFYCPEHAHLAADYARFAFCKKDENMVKAGEILSTINN
eukprot:TRINITY_DN6117_c0_g1_i1.p1 TRINITY_DN6117_c0_g1~~TRINITY_DN6117_c0_g1_i1.p1  ORF type:complete len:450 (-),score=109.28 TRINITY_DN6117_c0_g1_i1:20-1333(-)